MSTPFRFTTYTLSILFLLAGCGGGSSDSTTSPTPADPTVATKTNQTISGHPHKIDYYIPSNATAVVVFLHGGGGKKEGFAYNLGIKNDSTTSNFALNSTGQTWLTTQKVVAVFPQGENITGLNWTWSNYVMTSGVDDVSFLQDLVAAIKSDTSIPTLSKFYIVGHSNGGMMANRMWCESPNTFDAYATFAGPPASSLHPSLGAHACAPTTVKPYISLVGDHDTVLQSTGNMNAALWTINPVMIGDTSVWVDATPRVLNDKAFHTTRVNLKCGGSVTSPTTVGTVTTYSDCSNAIQLKVFAQATVSGQATGGDHCLLALNGTCVTTLQGASGVDPKTAAIEFLKNF